MKYRVRVDRLPLRVMVVVSSMIQLQPGQFSLMCGGAS
jgi:hypothetical protein